MSRRTNHDFDELPYDVPIPASSVMFNSDGTVSLETAGEAPVINRGRRSNQHHDPHAKREAMLHELAGHLADLVEAGEMSDAEANDWYNMKADQWAQGLNRGRRRNAEMSFDEYWFDRGRRSGLSEDWDDYMKAWNNIPDAKRLKSTRDLMRAGDQFRRGWQVGREEHNKRLAWGRRHNPTIGGYQAALRAAAPQIAELSEGYWDDALIARLTALERKYNERLNSEVFDELYYYGIAEVSKAASR